MPSGFTIIEILGGRITDYHGSTTGVFEMHAVPTVPFTAADGTIVEPKHHRIIPVTVQNVPQTVGVTTQTVPQLVFGNFLLYANTNALVNKLARYRFELWRNGSRFMVLSQYSNVRVPHELESISWTTLATFNNPLAPVPIDRTVLSSEQILDLMGNTLDQSGRITTIEVEINAARGGQVSLDARLDSMEELIGSGGDLEPRVEALEQEILAAREGEDDVDSRLDALSLSVSAHTTLLSSLEVEVTNARGGQGSLDVRFDNIEAALSGLSGHGARISALETEVINARGGQANVDARLDSIESNLGSQTLNGLTDVTIAVPTTGHFVRYNGSQWVNTALAVGDIPSIPATKVADGTISDAEFLHLNGATSNLQDQITARLTQAAGDGRYSQLGHTHTKSQITDFGHTHVLADITNAGTAAAINVPSSGNAAPGEAVLGSDTRLSDARTPLAHAHIAANITDFAAEVESSLEAGTDLLNMDRKVYVGGRLDAGNANDPTSDFVATGHYFDGVRVLHEYTGDVTLWDKYSGMNVYMSVFPSNSTTSTTDIQGGQFEASVTTSNDFYAVFGIHALAAIIGSGNITSTLIGQMAKAFNMSTGTVAEARGHSSWIRNTTTGIITTAIGHRITIDNNSTGSYGTMIGANVVINISGGSVGTFHGFRVSAGTNSGTIGERNGLTIENQNVGTVTTVRNIYSKGDTQNVFEGLIKSTRADGSAPIDVVSTTVCPNLNADLLDGLNSSAFALAGHTHVIADVTGLQTALDSKAGGNGTANRLVKYTNTTGGLANSLLSDDGTNTVTHNGTSAAAIFKMPNFRLMDGGTTFQVHFWNAAGSDFAYMRAKGLVVSDSGTNGRIIIGWPNQDIITLDSAGEINWSNNTTQSNQTKTVGIASPASGVLRISDGASGFGQLRVGSLGVGNSAAATTPGSVTKKVELFDTAGASLGFIAIYSSIS